MPDDGWFHVEVTVDASEVDVVSGALWSAGVAGIEERIGGGAPATTTLVVAVSGHVLDAATTVLAGRRTDVTPVAADTGLDAWREHADVVRVERVAVVPAWLSPPADAPVVVTIEPGRSFGSGGHVTTQLALAMLQREPLHGARVLDVGTGSGVLAITAAKLGAASVVAVDVDAAAVDVACANVAANDVVSVVDVRGGTVGEVGEVVDLVVANITASVLIDIREALVAPIAPGGRLVLSGVLDERCDEVRDAYERIEWVDEIHAQGWVGLRGVCGR